MPEDELQALFNDDAVEHGFAGEDAGFARVIVRLETAESIQDDRSGNQAVNQGVGGVDAGLVEARVVGNHLRHDVVICSEGHAGGNDEWGEPLEVVRTQAHRAGPDGCLIAQEIARQVADQYIVLRRRLRRWRIGKRRAIDGRWCGCGLRRSGKPET